MKMNKIELDEYLTQFNETYHVIATFIAHCFSLEFTDQAVTSLSTLFMFCLYHYVLPCIYVAHYFSLNCRKTPSSCYVNKCWSL